MSVNDKINLKLAEFQAKINELIEKVKTYLAQYELYVLISSGIGILGLVFVITGILIL